MDNRRRGNRFGRCPTWWVRDGLIKDFKGGSSTGKSIAGFKCLIAITLNIDFYDLTAQISYSELERLTGLSRPMVSQGVSLLNELGILEVQKGYRHTYRLLNKPGDDRWGKLPHAYLKAELPNIPNRGRNTLFALRLYFQLIADRPNDSPSVSMTHITINQKVGTQPRDIKPSIDILFNHMLIGVNRDPDTSAYVHNVYRIRGI